jgi:hypothetical protein
VLVHHASVGGWGRTDAKRPTSVCRVEGTSGLVIVVWSGTNPGSKTVTPDRVRYDIVYTSGFRLENQEFLTNHGRFVAVGP